MKIKPIETAYRGYRFRSRLEARWAVFFDCLQIRWEYEYEGFNLSDGNKYLPDFYLPTFDGGTWCEVKPDGGDFSKAKMFSLDTGFKMWLCEGVPDKAVYKYYNLQYKDAPIVWCGIPNWSQATGKDRFFVCPCCFHCADLCLTDIKISLSGDDIKVFNSCDYSLINEAVSMAKMARFEYGENGGFKSISKITSDILANIQC